MRIYCGTGHMAAICCEELGLSQAMITRKVRDFNHSSSFAVDEVFSAILVHSHVQCSACCPRLIQIVAHGPNLSLYLLTNFCNRGSVRFRLTYPDRIPKRSQLRFESLSCMNAVLLVWDCFSCIQFYLHLVIGHVDILCPAIFSSTSCLATCFVYSHHIAHDF
jgi:hypothetical protein